MKRQLNVKPPRLAIRFFEWYCRNASVEDLHGDIEELFYADVQRMSTGKAKRKYWLRVMSLLLSYAIKKRKRESQYHPFQSNAVSGAMIRSYFKIGWRTILGSKTNSAIHVLGLLFGILASLIVYLIAAYEFGFDKFHRDHQRIYRVVAEVTESTGENLHFIRLPIPAVPALRSEVPGFETVAGLIPFRAKITVPAHSGPMLEFESTLPGTPYVATAITESQYFEIFEYTWLAGSRENALANPNSVVITHTRAKRYFGDLPLEKIIGKQIIYQDSLNASVTGIVEDWKYSSDLKFTDFISYSSLQTGFLKRNVSSESWKQQYLASWAFVKLSAGVRADKLIQPLDQLVAHHGDPKTKLALRLEPLSSIHFNSEIIENPVRTAHLPTLYTLIGIASFILILAIVNFVILSTAQSIRRKKEIGVRKALGGGRASLIFQFLTETFLITTIAVLLAAMLVKPVLNQFYSFVPDGFHVDLLTRSFVAFFVSIIVVSTLLAGSYPALIQSGYMPVNNLKGATSERGRNWSLGKGLIILQFVISLVFIISNTVIRSQLDYVREKDLGFSADAIVIVDGPRGEDLAKLRVFANKVKSLAGVDRVATQWLSPMTDNPRGMKLKFKITDEKDFGVTQVAGDEEFIPLYEIKLLAGRNVVPSDSVNEFVINESLSRLMGNINPVDAIGKLLYWNDKPYPVVGVAMDFHTKSLHSVIDPMCIINRREREGSVAIKLSTKGKDSRQISKTFAAIESKWGEVYAANFQMKFYDDTLSLLYEKDVRASRLMTVSTAVAIFISCIGLFGLTLFTTENRSKEISIRKVLGASMLNIIAMLSNQITRVIMVALFIASPLAWYLMRQWLQGFAYHVSLSPWTFLLSGAAALVISFLTISYLAVSAALKNPVENLKSE